MVQYVCKCGEVKFEVVGEPFICFNCHCPSCVAICKYMDAKEPKGTSPMVDGGFGASLWDIPNIKLEGQETKLEHFKVGDRGGNFRTYTKCCNTLVFGAGGAEFPFPARPIPRNCLQNDDGSPWTPKQATIYNMLLKFRNKRDKDAIPEPKCTGLCPGFLGKGVPKLLYAKMCCCLAPPIPPIYNPTPREVCPESLKPPPP